MENDITYDEWQQITKQRYNPRAPRMVLQTETILDSSLEITLENFLDRISETEERLHEYVDSARVEIADGCLIVYWRRPETSTEIDDKIAQMLAVIRKNTEAHIKAKARAAVALEKVDEVERALYERLKAKYEGGFNEG